MSSINKVIIIGHLGADPETRSAQDGRKIVNLRVATSEKWKDKNTGEKREKTHWHTVVIFNEGIGGVAERYLRKGSRCYLSGKLVTRKWRDQSGADRYSTEVVMDYGAELVLLGDSNGAHDAGQSDYDDSPAPAATATRGNYANKQLANPNDPSDLGNYGLESDRVPF